MDSWYKLRVAGVRDSIIIKLMNLCEEFEEIFLHDRVFYSEFMRLKDEDISKILNSYKINLDFYREKMLNLNIETISIKEKEYPLYLKNISHPPVFLYMKGKMTFYEKNIGVVGTRKMTSYGESACKGLVGDLVRAGVTITSGLATGVDVTAHKRALNLGGNTIAVVGSGLDVVYPPENKYEWERITKEGTLISEYPLGTPPDRYNFPRRNRIIVGLTRGVAVIESYKKGGSLITAKLALEENRDVFIIPGFPNYPSFEGNNNLIKDSYGKLVTSGKDILEEYGWTGENEININVDIGAEEGKIYSALVVEKSLDELMTETKISIGKLLGLLTNLELKKLVRAIAGGKYRRV
ncbi:DNA-processing protein DprA [Psychrilyobacter sp.]|uniref:DNA-processing protein DprA n=1 Tax=Psychrilyobacter sp. TaxID=2586924 RepID=UPI003018898D